MTEASLKKAMRASPCSLMDCGEVGRCGKQQVKKEQGIEQPTTTVKHLQQQTQAFVILTHTPHYITAHHETQHTTAQMPTLPGSEAETSTLTHTFLPSGLEILSPAAEKLL